MMTRKLPSKRIIYKSFIFPVDWGAEQALRKPASGKTVPQDISPCCARRLRWDEVSRPVSKASPMEAPAKNAILHAFALIPENYLAV